MRPSMASEGEDGDCDQEQSNGVCRQNGQQGDAPPPALPEHPPFQAVGSGLDIKAICELGWT
jgi:hypothetical protein